MKGMDIFCASQAATAICLAMDEPSSSSTIQLGRAIDRHNPIIRDSRRIPKSLPVCLSASPSNPLPSPHKHHHENRKSSGKENDQIKKKFSAKGIIDQKTKLNANTGRKSWGCTKPGDFISPPGSSRYLLSERSDTDSLGGSTRFDPVVNLFQAEPSKSQLELFQAEPSKSQLVKAGEFCDDQKPPASSGSPNQVVVLRVSLHCRGCERKMRKHISRMEGVTSFNIDFAAKKVTVVGDVTPLGVLASISKVKNAQLWTPAISSSAKTPVNNSEFKKFRGEAGGLQDSFIAGFV